MATFFDEITDFASAFEVRFERCTGRLRQSSLVSLSHRLSLQVSKARYQRKYGE